MEASGTKQQTSGGGIMATTEITYLRNELEVMNRLKRTDC